MQMSECQAKGHELQRGGNGQASQVSGQAHKSVLYACAQAVMYKLMY